MSHIEFLAAFENAGFIRDGQLQESVVRKASASDILDFAQQTAEVSAVDALPVSDSVFSFAATTTLGGGTTPCSSVECRTKHVASLREFAALYSDRVLIHNFFAERFAHRNRLLAQGDDEVRERFLADLAVLVELWPLIEAQIVEPVTLTGAICPHCFAERKPTSTLGQHIASLQDSLADNYLATMRVIVRDHEHPRLGLSAPGLTFDHPLVRSHDGLHEIVAQLAPGVRAKLRRGLSVKLPAGLLVDLKPHKMLAAEVLRDVRFGLAMAAATRSSFLTEHPAQRDLLGALAGDDELLRKNDVIRANLTTMMPFVADVSPKDLLELRQQEGDAFTLFRKALTDAISESRKGGREFDDSAARELYSDVLNPRLAELNIKVKNAKRHFRLRPTRESFAWVGAISFGLLSGALNHGLGEMVKELGLVAAAKAGLSKTLGDANHEESVRADPMYFLWKVQQRAKPSKGIPWRG